MPVATRTAALQSAIAATPTARLPDLARRWHRRASRAERGSLTEHAWRRAGEAAHAAYLWRLETEAIPTPRTIKGAARQVESVLLWLVAFADLRPHAPRLCVQCAKPRNFGHDDCDLSTARRAAEEEELADLVEAMPRLDLWMGRQVQARRAA